MLLLERQEAYRLRYAAENPGWQPATHLYRDLVAGHLAPSTRVLDLGCGRGGVVEELRSPAALSVGLDPDLTSLREHRIPGFPRICGLAESLPYPNNSFDLVCCSWVLEHLSDPARVFAAVARVLAPGGHFVFLTPNRRHPLLALNRALHWTQGRLVDRLYGRDVADTFPAFYRANAPGDIERWAGQAGLVRVAFRLVGDPTYLAFGESLYRLACLLERLAPVSLRVHLVGDYTLTLPPSANQRGSAPVRRR